MNIEKIYINDLHKFIDFLGNGFKIDSYLKKKFINNLVYSNKELGFYGYGAYDENNLLIGGILTINQGIINRKYIINLALFYFSEKKRKGYSLKFINTVTKELYKNEFLITNYAPSNNASYIFRLLGYRNMEIKRVKITLFDLLKYFLNIIFYFSNSNNFIKIFKKTKFKNFKPKISEDILCFRLVEKNKRILSFYGLKTYSKIGWKKFLKCPIFVIYYSSDEKILQSKLNIILLYLLLKYKVFALYVDINNKFLINNLKNKSINLKYYIFKNNLNISSISALGSELGFRRIK